MGAEPIAGGTKLSLLCLSSNSAKELVLPSKEKDFRVGDHPCLATELLQMRKNSQLAKGHDGQAGVLGQAHKAFQKLGFYCCNRGKL